MRTITFSSFCVSLFLSFNATISHAAPSPYQTQVLADKPMAYYSFEEASGTVAKNDGTKGASANATYMPGPAKGEAGPRPPEFPGFNSDNRAASFNGTSDFVDTGLQLLDGLGAFTIEVWVKEPAVQSASRIGFAGQNDAVEYGLISPNTVQIWTPSGGSLNTAWSFPTGTWHHVVSVGDGNSLRTYYDGKLVGAAGTATASYGSSGDSVHIGGGGVYDTTGNFFRGQLDEVALYDTALREDRIKAHYSAAFVSASDTTPLAIGDASGSVKFTTATVVFNKGVTADTAGNKANYSLDGGLTVSDVKIVDLKTVTLTTSKQTSGTKYTVTAKNIKDLAGTVSATDVKGSFTAYVPVRGQLYFEAYFNIAGTPVQNLLDEPKYPDSPDQVGYLVGNFDTRAIYADDSHENYGARITGFLVPPATGEYRFFIRSDDAGQLFLSTDENPANAAVIAEQTGCCNAWTTAQSSANISLQAGKRYFIQALLKEGGGNDWLRIAMKGPGEDLNTVPPMANPNVNATTVDPATIPWNSIESYFDPDGVSLNITQQPQNAAAVEGTTATLKVAATSTPKPSTRLASIGVAYQWQRAEPGSTSFKDIAGAISASYTTPRLLNKDNGAKYRAVVISGGKTLNSGEAALTITPDKISPVLLGAKGSPNLTEVTLTFSEIINAASATATANYKISSASGSLNVTAAALSADGAKVILTTAKQTLGTKYTVTVNNVTDFATVPNKIAADSKAGFFPLGKIAQDANGLIVFEAENYDRNLDGLWIKDTARGNPSGGASMVIPSGGSEAASKLEYDVVFKTPGTYIIWYRASGNDGGSDSGWFHIDGDRDPNRTTGNQDSMTGFSGALDFVWLSNPQDGGGQFTFDVGTPGPHVLAVARRENNAYFDKFIVTPDPNFRPTGFGPPETREGLPAPPTVTITGPTDGQKFSTGANITLTANASGAAGIAMARVEFSANGVVVGQATQSPFTFTWSNVKEGSYTLRAIATDEVGGSTTSASIQIKVGNPPPLIYFVTADPGPLTYAGDIAVYNRLLKRGFDVVLARGSDVPADGSTAKGSSLIIQSSSLGSGTVENADPAGGPAIGKFKSLAIPAMEWEASSQDAFGFQEANGTTTADQTQINIVDSTHPLAAGFPKGLLTVSTAEPYSQGTPTGAHVIATLAGDPTQAVIYYYDKGEKGFNGFVMPEKRVFFFFGDNTAAVATTDGLKLFDAAVDWLLGGVTVKPPAPTLSVARTPTGLTLTFTGTLQSASAVTGPWADEANSKSPLAVTPASGQKFYRTKQ